MNNIAIDVQVNPDIICPTIIGFLYNRPTNTGQVTSYATGDDAWQLANGTYDYNTPTNPATIVQLDTSHATPFFMLKENNKLGNKFRLTDENGDHYTDPIAGVKNVAGAYTIDYVIDHASGLAFWFERGVSNWATAISNANAATDNSFTDWRIPDIKTLWNLTYQFTSNPSFSFNYFPFIANQIRECWSSTTNEDTTTQASTIALLNRIFQRAKTDSKDYILVRNHY